MSNLIYFMVCVCYCLSVRLCVCVCTVCTVSCSGKSHWEIVGITIDHQPDILSPHASSLAILKTLNLEFLRYRIGKEIVVGYFIFLLCFNFFPLLLSLFICFTLCYFFSLVSSPVCVRPCLSIS